MNEGTEFFGAEPSQSLLTWLAQEGQAVGAAKIWVVGPGDPPSHLPPGPWVVVSDIALDEAQRQSWLSLLDEESSLLAPWTESTLKGALGAKSLDSAALARLYLQGGRALADQMVRIFLLQSRSLLDSAASAWRQGQVSQARTQLLRLSELAGGVGAGELQRMLLAAEPDWERLLRELEDSCRTLEHQHRQDRTV